MHFALLTTETDIYPLHQVQDVNTVARKEMAMGIDVNAMPKRGVGLMRLPENDGVIDHEQVCKMVDMYMEAGMNYFDTAYVYHGGKSEVAAREALVKRHPRELYAGNKTPCLGDQTSFRCQKNF